MAEFRGRMAIRSSGRRRAEEKNSHVTFVLEVSSKPGPFQIKGSGTRHSGSRIMSGTHPHPPRQKLPASCQE